MFRRISLNQTFEIFLNNFLKNTKRIYFLHLNNFFHLLSQENNLYIKLNRIYRKAIYE